MFMPNSAQALLSRLRISRNQTPSEAPHTTTVPVRWPISCGGVPDGPFAFAARLVDVPHPVHRLADAAARPVEGRHAHVPGSLLPLAVCTAQRRSRLAVTAEPSTRCR